MQHKDVLTTGEVARICHVAPRTVSKWFDSGALKGYRIPGSRDRRIPISGLIAFLRANGMPLDGLDGGVCRVLIVAEAPSPDLVRAFGASDRHEVRVAANGFEAGVLAQQFRPHAVVLDAAGEPEEVAAICRNIKASASFETTKIIAAAPPDPDAEQRLLAAGFDATVTRPYSFAEVALAVENVTNLIL